VLGLDGELVDLEKFGSTFGENLYHQVPWSLGIYISLCTYLHIHK
jgi:hypothetical protein